MIGKTISHYKILEKLGQGGMGVVYKAEDTELERTVALKFLPAQALEDDEERERFIHEARSAAAIDQANICTVYEIGKAEGRTFIAMAFIDGRSLKEAIEAGPMRLDEAMDIAIQIAEGLQAAHDKGVIHRDVKPANVMLTAKGHAKIMDFGLAKSARGVVVTKASTTLGTVGYMSPEQARGEEVDNRTDVWSSGAVLHEMVTGSRPFRGDYEQAVIYSILNESPAPATGLRTGVPIDLERIILRCLEKSPDDRYQTASDLVSDLRRARRVMSEESATGDSVMSAAATESGAGGAAAREGGARSGVGTAATQGNRTRRTRNWALITAFIVLAAIAVIIFRPYFAPPAKIDLKGPVVGETESMEPPSGDTEQARKMVVVLPFENLGPPENAYFADGMTEEITSRLARVKALGVISRTSAVQYDRTGKTMRQIGDDLGVDCVLEGTVRWDGVVAGGSRVRVTPQLIRVSDDTHLWAESYDRELQDIFAVQSDIAGQVVRKLGVTLLEPERGAIETRPTQNMDAYHAYLRGIEYALRTDWLEDDLQMARQMFERAVALDPDFALAYAELSQIHSRICHFGLDISDERLSMAKEAAARALEINPELPEAHMAMGYYHYWGLLDYEPALEEFAIAETALSNDPRILEALGYILRRQGKFDEALEKLLRALQSSPRDASLIFEVGMTYTTIREYAEADGYYDRSISILPDQMIAYGFKAENAWLWKGDLQEARRLLQIVGRRNETYTVWFWLELEKLERNYEAGLETISQLSLDNEAAIWNYSPRTLLLAEMYGFMGERSTARAYYDSTRVLLEGLLEGYPEKPEIHILLGAAYAGLDRKEDAIRHGKRALELHPLSKDYFDGPYLIEQLAAIYTKVGEFDLAIDQLEYLLSIPCDFSAELYRIDPEWDPLRDHPRFQKLLEEHGGIDQ